mmetsp:Transcript_3541/g.7330  ORF Transcript_3541/g.7330 Transcript_3541/m.7330 type:complete len:190 (-) Transcript_3541:128-697(-)|eukprot:CAMPEP_0194340596 /NCGR_PEP_ID=MMETSP0171-20130528/86915_1 /TAXON_ID=218684 /ORGANISM="Corethron pennatum, Strain L29A3" /LENGTH=189 /DNA_ID=CAMNT_0039105607 /DNA_START=78 /DNA_END=647 /DNA_ORIENTATION=+
MEHKICMASILFVFVLIAIVITTILVSISKQGIPKVTPKVSLTSDEWVSVLSSTKINLDGIETKFPIEVENKYDFPLNIGVAVGLFYPGANSGNDGIKFAQGTSDLTVPARSTSTEWVDVFSMWLDIGETLAMTNALLDECGGCLFVSNCKDQMTLWTVVTPYIFDSVDIPIDFEVELKLNCTTFSRFS